MILAYEMCKLCKNGVILHVYKLSKPPFYVVPKVFVPTDILVKRVVGTGKSKCGKQTRSMLV